MMQIDPDKVVAWVIFVFGTGLVGMGRYIWVLKEKQEESTAIQLKIMNDQMSAILEKLKKVDSIEVKVEQHTDDIGNIRVNIARINEKLKIETKD